MRALKYNIKPTHTRTKCDYEPIALVSGFTLKVKRK